MDQWIIHQTYDALGRIARLQRPLAVSPNLNHIEHYYYDDVRRIQEVFTSLEAPTDGDETPGEDDSQSLITWAEREYTHTAGPGSYVDEYVCEVGNLNTSQTPLYHLQDANYNVLGLASAAGSVVRQYTLDPYGQLLHREDRAAAFESRVGHQGLFFTRLDDAQGYADLTVNTIAPGSNGASPLTTAVDGVYFTVNRTYSPYIGRWMQRDPLASGLPTLMSLARNGATVLADPLVPDADAILADGANHHTWSSSNPVGSTDRLGLFGGLVSAFAPVSAVDVYADYNGQVVESGVSVLEANFGTLSMYAVDQDLDAEWAEDWDFDDQEYSRSSISSTQLGSDTSAHEGMTLAGGAPFTQPSLPPNTIINQGGIQIVHYYPQNHAPAHLHVREHGRPEVRIGANGRTLAGEGQLSAKAQRVVRSNLSRIRTVTNSIRRFVRYERHLQHLRSADSVRRLLEWTKRRRR